MLSENIFFCPALGLGIIMTKWSAIIHNSCPTHCHYLQVMTFSQVKRMSRVMKVRQCLYERFTVYRKAHCPIRFNFCFYRLQLFCGKWHKNPH